MLETRIVTGQDCGVVPPQVRDLPPRLKEVALVLYLGGGMTAHAVGGRLERKPSYGALRSMLNRLCDKGILKREKITGSKRSGSNRIPFVYFPNISADPMRRAILRQIARDYFDGSLHNVVLTAIDVLDDDRPAQSAGGSRVRRSRKPARLHVVGSSRVDLQACKLEYSIVSPK